MKVTVSKQSKSSIFSGETERDNFIPSLLGTVGSWGQKSFVSWLVETLGVLEDDKDDAPQKYV